MDNKSYITRRKLLTTLGAAGTVLASQELFISPVAAATPSESGVIPTLEGGADGRSLKQSVNIQSFGAKCDGVTDDTEAVRAAIAFAEKNLLSVYIPGVAVISGEIEIKKPIMVFGNGAGGGYGADALIKYRQVSGFLVKGVGEKRIRTRRLHRSSDSDPEDEPLSVALNVQSENVTFRDFSVFLDFDRQESSPDHYGAEWDCGIFVGCRSHFVQQNIHVLGYWRVASWYYDVTYGSGLRRFTDLDGKAYDNRISISGADGCTMIKCFCMGGKWGVFVGGALPKAGEEKYGTPYYDTFLKRTKSDNRGGFGFSDFTTVACSFYGTEHHSRYRRDKATGDYLTDTAGGVMFVDGIAGNRSGVLQGHRHLSTRFASWEPFTVKLDRVQRVQFIGCHFENRSGNKVFNQDKTMVNIQQETYGLITATDRTKNLMLIGAGGRIDKRYIPEKLSFHNLFSSSSPKISETTDVLVADGFRSLSGELDLRSDTDQDAVLIRKGKEINVSFKGDAAIFGGHILPARDNQLSLGSSTARFEDIYATNGPVVSSDRHAKQQIEPIPEDVLNAWSEVNFLRFKMNDAVEKKRGKARWHIGVIAQEIESAFKRHGLNAFEYGLLCYDGKKDTDNVGEYKNVDASESGLYSIRPDECLMLEMALMRREIQKLKQK